MKHPPEFLALVDEAKKRITELSPEEVRKAVKAGAVVIDVREKEEFAGGHVPGQSTSAAAHSRCAWRW